MGIVYARTNGQVMWLIGKQGAMHVTQEAGKSHANLDGFTMAKRVGRVMQASLGGERVPVPASASIE